MFGLVVTIATIPTLLHGTYAITCDPGYYGSSCENVCDPRCFTCNNANQCGSCPDGTYGSLCGSKCSGYCATCDKNGKCLSCVPGYHGTGTNCGNSCSASCAHCSSATSCHLCLPSYNCNTTCGPKCASCTTNTICDSCLPGYFGSSCMSKCPYECYGGTCDRSSGKCKCRDGFTGDRCNTCVWGKYGTNCASSCETGCLTCELQENNLLYKCTSCENGKYGEGCDKDCSVGCNGVSCNRWGGTCSSDCLDGYQGDWCCLPGYDNEGCTPLPTIPATCPVNCASCTSTTECIRCETGYYGGTCDTLCPDNCNNSKCEKSTGSCFACTVGFYGDRCTNVCHTNCDNKGCYQDTGLCYGCDAGFYTETCTELCPKNCLNNQCSIDGSCLNCITGYYGNACESKCLQNCMNDTCLQEGKCNACKPGYYNPFCNLTCPDNCISGVCDTVTGGCDQGCKTGYTGAQCNMTCDVNCKTCKQTVSTICHSCKDNRYGRDGDTFTCDDECSLTCANGACNDNNGTCSQGCVDGSWGHFCDRSCSNGCKDSLCDHVSGICNSCKDGYTGSTCLSCLPGFYNNTDGECVKCSVGCNNSICDEHGTCVDGCAPLHYGVMCSTRCDTYCVDQKCNTTTGSCLRGCVDGFVTSTTGCVEAVKKSADRQVALIGGAAGGGAVAVIVIVVLVVCLIRRRGNARKKNDENKKNTVEDFNVSAEQTGPVYAVVIKNRASKPDADTQSATTSSTVINPAYQQPPSSRTMDPVLEIDDDDNTVNLEEQRESRIRSSTENTYYNAAKMSVSKLADYVACKGSVSFKEEFMTFPRGLRKSYKVSQIKENMWKNRYQGIYPYDDSRVKVSGGDTDYINASFIDGFRKKNAYIASLGPTVKQMNDFGVFWRMVWQQRVEKIIMLTNLTEEGKPKCDQYWPPVGNTRTYSDITVTCHSDDSYADFTLRSFTLSKRKEKRSIHQLHFTAWPDRGVPEDVTGLVEFRQKDLGITAKLDGPLLVHCSAGIGRTGTYIGLDILTREGETEKTVDIPRCVRQMRQNRPNMIQTPEQYHFLYEAVVHSLTLNSKPIQGEKFQTYVASLSKEMYREQFTKLQTTLSKISGEDIDAVKNNSMVDAKHRDNVNVQGDVGRPRLLMSSGPGYTDCINAVYINSFKQRRHYIVAQSPLPTTVLDFLNFVTQERCSCIVSFEPGSKKGTGEYYPADNQVLRKDNYTVTCSIVESSKTFVQRKLKVVYKARNQSAQTGFIPHLQFTDWDDTSNVPKSAATFVQFLNHIEKTSREHTDQGPILVHCRDGGSKSGLMCVVSVLLQKMEIEHEVSVVNTVRQVKARRHNAVCNEDQFEFCHVCVSEYLRSFDIYSNFAPASI